jgi:hypothetical protein
VAECKVVVLFLFCSGMHKRGFAVPGNLAPVRRRFSLLWWYTQRDDIRFVAGNEKQLTSKTGRTKESCRSEMIYSSLLRFLAASLLAEGLSSLSL